MSWSASSPGVANSFASRLDHERQATGQRKPTGAGPVPFNALLGLI